MPKARHILVGLVVLASCARGGAPTALAFPPAGSTETVDPFGVRKIYPTAPGGREWYLPASAAELEGRGLRPESRDVLAVAPGTYRVSGQVRLNVVSQRPWAWWRDVEMTAYFRFVAAEAPGKDGQAPHWELFARGERHTKGLVTGASINEGTVAPAGTRTWPGYPFGEGAVDATCLGTAYHANVYPDGRVLFEKELSHTAGYAAERRAEKRVTDFADPKNRWFGMKFVVRNAKSGGAVHLEAWLDKNADNQWSKVAETDDRGGWAARGPLNGCDMPPFSYAPDQIIDWAGPWVTFRSDAIFGDLRWLSVRDVGPLP